MIKRHFTLEKARILGDNLAVDWGRVDLEKFRLGLNFEFDQRLKNQEAIVSEEDPFLAGRVVLKRLGESSDYYNRQSVTSFNAESLF